MTQQAAIDTDWHNSPLETFTSRWWLCLTIPRHERRVARALSSAGIGCYVPQVEQYGRDREGRRCRVRVPLFQSYVFVNSDFFSRRELYDNPKARSSVRSVFDVPNQQRFDREIKAFELAEINGLLTGETFNELVVGRLCRVRPPHIYQGQVGTLIQRNEKKQRFTIQLTNLNYSASVEIDPKYLELEEVSAA
jgi:hypothetical protein